MKITASGGTDGGNIVFFWPENLPDEFDLKFKEDPIELVEILRHNGKLIWFPCDGDGDYSVSIFVRMSVPDDLLAVSKEEERIPALTVHGEGYFGGMEYMFKTDRAFLDKYPGMCESVMIPDGTYTATIYSTNAPESAYEEWISKQAGANAKRLWDIHGCLAASAVFSVLASIVSVFVLWWPLWLYAVMIAALLSVVAIGVSRSGPYKVARQASEDYGEAYPAYVVHLDG